MAARLLCRPVLRKLRSDVAPPHWCAFRPQWASPVPPRPPRPSVTPPTPTLGALAVVLSDLVLPTEKGEWVLERSCSLRGPLGHTPGVNTVEVCNSLGRTLFGNGCRTPRTISLASRGRSTASSHHQMHLEWLLEIQLLQPFPLEVLNQQVRGRAQQGRM